MVQNNLDTSCRHNMSRPEAKFGMSHCLWYCPGPTKRRISNFSLVCQPVCQLVYQLVCQLVCQLVYQLLAYQLVYQLAYQLKVRDSSFPRAGKVMDTQAHKLIIEILHAILIALLVHLYCLLILVHMALHALVFDIWSRCICMCMLCVFLDNVLSVR